MSKNEIKNKLSFIDFLKQEFSMMSAIPEIETEKNKQSASRQTQKKLNWFSPSQPSRNLRDVLEVKLGGTEEDLDDFKSENDVDIDDESVNNWSERHHSDKKHLFHQGKERAASRKKPVTEFLNQPYFNIPGVLSYCREDKNIEERSNWIDKSLVLVFAVFILAVVSSAYLLDNSLTTGSQKIKVDTSQVKTVIKPSQATLANYIRTNNEWLEKQFGNEQDTIALKAEDIFGKKVSATETIDETNQNNKKSDVDRLKMIANNIGSKLYNYFSGLKNDQIDASLILNNTVANIFTK